MRITIWNPSRGVGGDKVLELMAVTLINLWDEAAGDKQKVTGPVSENRRGWGFAFKKRECDNRPRFKNPVIKETL